MRLGSLLARLLLSATVTLLVFIAICGFSLNKAFETSAEQTQDQRMRSLVYALLGNVQNLGGNELTLRSDRLPDVRLERPQSGLEAALFSDSAALLWGSPSLRDNVATPAALNPGQWRFEHLPGQFVMAFGLRFDDGVSPPLRYTLMVIEDDGAHRAQIKAFRRSLGAWLSAGALALLLLQIVVVHWGLRPLKTLAKELRRVEQNESDHIGGKYPDELRPITEGLNAMIVAERTQQARYRNALSDLAHSLKTPLAVLQGVAERPNAPDVQGVMEDQLARMGGIVAHQLKRASTLGARTLAEPIFLKPIIDKIISALTKVYARRATQFVNHVTAELKMRADSGDVFEVLGNLLDNAAKYGGGMVHITAQRNSGLVQICIEDNGNGFPENAMLMLERGVRADSMEEGQGLGLAAVKDIVSAYEGEIVLNKSALGGGKVNLSLKA